MTASAKATLSPSENITVGAIGGAVETALQMPNITYKFCSQEGRPFQRTFYGWYRGVLIQASNNSIHCCVCSNEFL